MNALLNIPAHKGCKNCGKCCGWIPASGEEVADIKAWIVNHPEIRPLIRKSNNINCPFRDDENARCLIYPVRPLMCRLFGVVEGMECECGNLIQIDGEPFIADYLRGGRILVLNSIQWPE